MVVSEMGETWSPNTAPPSVAETVRMVSVPLPPRMVTAIGTRTPNVPQEVPVANAMAPARMKKKICLGYRHGTAQTLPVKAPKKEKRQEDRTVLIFRCDGRYALEKRPSKGLLAGLWQFPNVAGKLDPVQALATAENWGVKPRDILRETEKKHIFTHIQWNMTGIYLEVSEPSGNFQWFTAEEIRNEAALPTAFRQFWEEI